MSEFCSFDRALPQLVWSCRIPKLRKLTNASSTMFEAMISVIETITGPSVLGRMWRKAIRRSLTPAAVAACTNSCSLRLRNMALTSRAMSGQDSSPKIRMSGITSP